MNNIRNPVYYNSKDVRLTIALFEPQIPPNTGNIARTCAALGIKLALIKPLGFSLDDRYLKRAGLDYWQYVKLSLFDDFNSFENSLSDNQRIIGCSSYGGSQLSQTEFMLNDVLLFGREDNGLPDAIRNRCDKITTIPMPLKANKDGENGVRSLNLSVSCGIIAHYAGCNLGIW